MTIEVLGGDIHLVDLKTRLPFRYGIATMTEAPHAFVRVHVLVDGRPATGIAAAADTPSSSSSFLTSSDSSSTDMPLM